MRFLGFINEDHLQDKAFVTYEKIKRDCQKFLKEVNGAEYEAMRGSGSMLSRAGNKITPRTDRRPKETPQKVHDIMNKSFKKKFGWYTRSEGVFVNSSKRMGVISYYGSPYYFYPVDGYSYVWSPKTIDIVLYLNDKRILDQDSFYLKKGVTDEQIQQVIDEIIPTYKKTGLKDALKNGSEIMFKCKAYYMVHTDYHIKYENI